ncbi:putative esterase protein [Corchorus olitorius]|uniref:S-formylglutathione hydrolase n=1 Tax=Corchorus olitorius TaxID=93759 RepID=A0A1R3GY43_9ROSI|nr:putative esterase protein [Corchorus olitorius]
MCDGHNKRYKHFSPTLGCSMTFYIYSHPSPSPSHKFPVLYWLHGLTCTDENFIAKSGAQRVASAEGVALIAPDTSPRGLNVEGEADSWDLGVGAGFYLNATQEKWKNWRMYDYVVKELPKLLIDHFPQLDTSKASIFGHSMGGHGMDDKFLHDQLMPHKFEMACRSVDAPLLLRLQPGYDHSYFFIATFIDDHIGHHSQALRL